MRRPRPSASSPTAVTDSRGWTSSVPSAPNDSSEDVQRIRIGRLVCGRGHEAPGGIGAPGGRVTAKRYNEIVSAPHSSRSEENTSELQSLIRISYDVFCLNKKHIIKIHVYSLHHAFTILHQPKRIQPQTPIHR